MNVKQYVLRASGHRMFIVWREEEPTVWTIGACVWRSWYIDVMITTSEQCICSKELPAQRAYPNFSIFPKIRSSFGIPKY